MNAEPIAITTSTESGKRPKITLAPTTINGMQEDQFIMTGYVPVVLSKMFGPLIFADLRIRADGDSCEWIIERQANAKWSEVARIPGQLDSDFDDVIE